MLKKLLKKIKNKKSFLINGRIVKITPLTFDEMFEVVFLILPYIKTFILAKMQVDETATPSDVYFDIIQNAVSQLNRKDAEKAMSIFLHQDIEFVEQMKFKDFQRMMPTIIRVNDLYETFIHLYNLGLINS
jgi:hypothetical protein